MQPIVMRVDSSREINPLEVAEVMQSDTGYWYIRLKGQDESILVMPYYADELLRVLRGLEPEPTNAERDAAANSCTDGYSG